MNLTHYREAFHLRIILSLVFCAGIAGLGGCTGPRTVTTEIPYRCVPLDMTPGPAPQGLTAAQWYKQAEIDSAKKAAEEARRKAEAEEENAKEIQASVETEIAQAQAEAWEADRQAIAAEQQVNNVGEGEATETSTWSNRFGMLSAGMEESGAAEGTLWLDNMATKSVGAETESRGHPSTGAPTISPNEARSNASAAQERLRTLQARAPSRIAEARARAEKTRQEADAQEAEYSAIRVALLTRDREAADVSEAIIEAFQEAHYVIENMPPYGPLPQGTKMTTNGVDLEEIFIDRYNVAAPLSMKLRKDREYRLFYEFTYVLSSEDKHIYLTMGTKLEWKFRLETRWGKCSLPTCCQTLTRELMSAIRTKLGIGPKEGKQ